MTYNWEIAWAVAFGLGAAASATAYGTLLERSVQRALRRHDRAGLLAWAPIRMAIPITVMVAAATKGGLCIAGAALGFYAGLRVACRRRTGVQP